MGWDIEEAKKIFEEASRFVLATHINPDADGLGSMLATALALKRRGKEVKVLVEEPVSEQYSFFHGFELISVFENESTQDFKGFVGVVFDLSEYERLGRVQEVFKRVNTKVVLDHQAEGSRDIEGLRLIDPKASATAEIVLELFRYLNWDLNRQEAENLLTAIYSDTGGFRYENTSEKTFLMAAELVRFGANPNQVAINLYENNPVQRLELLKRLLENKEFLCGGKALISTLSLRDFEECRARSSDSEDFASFLRSVRGVEVSAVVKEAEEGIVSVSLRSKGGINVAEIAAKEGGGGHKKAAGFRKKGTNLLEVVELVKKRIEEALV